MKIPSPLRLWSASSLLTCACWFVPAHAQVVHEDAPPLRYANGGRDDEQRRAIEHRAEEFSLRLSFSNDAGDELADVPVSVTTQDGQAVFAMRSAGPLLYLALPPGRYVVRADLRDRIETQTLEVPTSGARDLHLKQAAKLFPR